MKSLRNIAVGVDFSEGAESALKEASRIAHWEGAQLHAIHIVDTYFHDQVTAFCDIRISEVIDHCESRLEQWIERILGTNHQVKIHLSAGYPLEGLLDTVLQCRADLLILGAHGKNSRHHAAMGSFASKCTSKSPMDVLLVRPNHPAPFQKIVTCIDFSENSKKAARQAIHIAQMDLAQIEFLHVFEPLSRHMTLSPDYVLGACHFTPEHDALFASQLTTKLEHFAAELIEEAGGCDYSTKVIQGFDLRAEILDYLSDVSADLAVLGVRGRSKFRHMLIGTTAEDLIRHAHCSTLAVKPDGFGEPIEQTTSTH